ncbi:MAG: hypothetical protein QME93_12385 [Bacillota bacterium]|nr:hypothetical protein [Bacillota bacterium]
MLGAGRLGFLINLPVVNYFEHGSFLTAAHVLNLILQPGEEVPFHVKPVDVLFYAVKGRGTVQEKHHAREEEVLFPEVEKRGITGPK